jgi:hypothetical protein
MVEEGDCLSKNTTLIEILRTPDTSQIASLDPASILVVGLSRVESCDMYNKILPHFCINEHICKKPDTHI